MGEKFGHRQAWPLRLAPVAIIERVRMFKLKSYAKINLGLEILDKRPDGYHNLRTIFQTIDLFDEIEIRKNDTGNIRLTGTDKSIAWDKSNTILKAAETVYKNFDVSGGFDISVTKHIPPGSGLGGGSGNAAVVLMFLLDFFGLTPPWDDMIAMTAKIGADVPFFLMGGTALAEGIGEILTPIELKRSLPVTVAVPKVNVNTGSIFSHFNLTSTPRNSKIINSVTSENFEILENDLERVTFDLFPEIGNVKKSMTTLTDNLVLMSGSGAAVYSLADIDTSLLKKNFPGMTVFSTKMMDGETYFKRNGAWPSGKAPVFGAGIRRFKSCRPRYL